MPGSRLVIVTGKGGVGKTTVTAAVGRAAARHGLRTLLVEIAAPGRLAHVLGVAALGAEPTPVADDLDAVALDGSRALEEFVHGLMPLRILSNRLLASDTFRIVAAAVPGIPEAAMLARLLEWLETGDRRRGRWDVVVLDSPASGHSAPLLATPETLGGIASVGPLGQTLQRISAWLHDPARTTALVVALPEPWAVAEATELWGSLRDGLGIPVARPVLNAVFPRRFSKADEGLLDEAEQAGSIDARLVAAGRYFQRRREEEQRQVRELRRGTGERPVELPFVFSADMRLGDLDPLAEALWPAIA